VDRREILTVPMRLVRADELRILQLQSPGAVIECASCEHALDKKKEKQIAFCAVLRVQIGTGFPRICSAYRERH
jgi:hypothetical protein